jgi:hypothetical protein
MPVNNGKGSAKQLSREEIARKTVSIPVTFLRSLWYCFVKENRTETEDRSSHILKVPVDSNEK